MTKTKTLALRPEPITLVSAIKSNTQKAEFAVEKAREKVLELLAQPLLPVEQQKVYGTLDKFVQFYFLGQLVQKYPLISDEIFDLRKDIRMKGRSGDYDVDTPIVVQLPLDEQSKEKPEVFSARTTGARCGDGYKEEFYVQCSIPEITLEARAALADALRYSAEVTAKAYSDPLVSKVLMSKSLSAGKVLGPSSARYNLVWAPSTWDAKMIEKDPAIFMVYAGKNFNIHQWEIPGERSLDAMLREFGEDLKES